MAREETMGSDDNDLFIGEDKILEHFVDDDNATGTGLKMIDMTGWDMKWVLRKSDNAADPALFSKDASIQGVFNASPTVNTQRAVVTLTDDDLNTLKAIRYRYSWKRFDAGVETVTGFGDFIPKRVTAR